MNPTAPGIHALQSSALSPFSGATERRWAENAIRSQEAQLAAVRRRVDAHMRLYYRTPLADMAIADEPGCWRDRAATTPKGNARNGCLFCRGPFIAQYRYLDPARDPITGRFVSPYRAWRLLRGSAA